MRVSEEPVCIDIGKIQIFLPALEISRLCRAASEDELLGNPERMGNSILVIHRKGDFLAYMYSTLLIHSTH
jgi:hypothetical protein